MEKEDTSVVNVRAFGWSYFCINQLIIDDFLINP